MKKYFFLILFYLFFINATGQTSDSTAIKSSATLTSDDTFNQKELGSWQKHRFAIKLGAFFPFNNTDVKVGNNNGNNGTRIDFEKDLGFSSFSSSFIIDGTWRASRRSSFGLQYYYLGRNSTKTIERDIHFGDNVYPAQATVTANFNTQIARFYYGYAFISKPKIEVGALVGSHLLITDMSLKLETNFSEGGRFKNSYNFVTPLPDLGLWGNFGIAKKMNLFANINYFYIESGEYTGSIFSYSIAFSYDLNKNLGLELAYTGLNFDIEKQKNDLNGDLKWGYNGPSITLSYSFGKPPQL